MKPYTDLMIDLETLDTRTSAQILQIGWCFFDAYNMNRSKAVFEWFPTADDQISMGASASPETMQWWMGNRKEWEFQQQAERQPLDECLPHMQQVWNGAATEDTRVWAKGTHFDIPILSKFFPEPWSFRNIHDLRTLKLIAESVGIEYSSQNDRPHNALYDAANQATEVQVLCSTLATAKVSVD